MKNGLLTLLILFSLNAFAQKAEDIKAIKAMSGCYEVGFNFAETFSYHSDTTTVYTPSKEKHDKALEWVQIVEETPDKINLQHILIVGGEHIVKHWRQEWLYENKDFYTYDGNNRWLYNQKDTELIAGTWTQIVYGVSDNPRYTGNATWVHVDGRHFWESTADAPLPRREYTKRKDYNITRRTNVHEIVNDGWIHDQDNLKVLRNDVGEDVVIAEEKGHNTYTKVEDARCIVAQDYWKEHQEYWSKVRSSWNNQLATHQDFEMKSRIKGKALYKYLFSLDTTTPQDSINTIIENFIIKQNNKL